MTTDNAHHDAGWVDDHIEAYLDGALSEKDRIRFEDALEKNEAWQQELAFAINLRDELRAITTPNVSPELTRTIISRTRKAAWRAFIDRLKLIFLAPNLGPWKPALATLSLVLVAVALILSNQSKPAAPDAFTDTEIEQALAEVKWTLGYVSQTGKMTGDSVQELLGPILKDLPKE